VQKPILTPEQIAGHQVMWAEDNIKNYPYLLINPITDANGQTLPSGPVAYSQSAVIPPAMGALFQITELDMSEILGNPQQGEKMVSNISGKAVEMIQQRLDMQTFIYMSNFAKAMKRCGEIWLSIAKDIYVEEGRRMKKVGGNNDINNVTLMKPKLNQENGMVEVENDLSMANFDVVSDVGPSSASKKAATVQAITGMMQITQDPETLQVLGSMAMLNMEAEGVEDVQAYFRNRLIKMGVVKPTEEETAKLQAEMQGQQPDPNAQYLAAAAEEAQAKAAQARATVIKTLADSELAKAKTMETISGIDLKAQSQSLDMIEKLIQPPKVM
jgi:hypothetical protein